MSFAASRFEYRFRYPIHGVLYTLGFALPYLLPVFTAQNTWHIGMSLLARGGWLRFDAAALVLLCVALLLLGLGLGLRLWGSAYVGASVVHAPGMHGGALLADGPYRRTRNPLYLGTLLHTFGLALIMPPSGALFCIALIWVLQIRLALAEEPFLRERFGESYAEYAARVPRFLPSPTPLVPAAGERPRWGSALLSELYMVGVFLTFAVFGWSFNLDSLYRGVLISLGISLIARAAIPRPVATA